MTAAALVALAAAARSRSRAGASETARRHRRRGPAGRARTRTSPSSRTSSAPRAATGSAAWRTSRRCGRGSSARRRTRPLSELDRAYGGALAVYQNGEFESAVRTLRAIVEDLESIPESDEAYAQWMRALLRLAHAAATIGMDRDAQAALAKLARTDPDAAARPRPVLARLPAALRGGEGARFRALPKRRLTVLAEGRPGVVYVNGRTWDPTPAVAVAPRRAATGSAARPDGLRVPSFTIDLEAEDRTVVLDFAPRRVAPGERRAGPRARRRRSARTASSGRAPGSAPTSSSSRAG